MSRSRSYTTAAVLAALLSLANIIVAFALLPQGSDKVNSSADQAPYAVLMVEVVIGAIGLVAAYGVYRQQRWAVLVTLVMMSSMCWCRCRASRSARPRWPRSAQWSLCSSPGP